MLAAASLTESFNQIGKDFEAANPSVKVTFSFGGSSGLATQITSGAPADVFAAASPATMKTVTDAGDATGTPVTFVKNQLVIAVPKGNPKGIDHAGRPDQARPQGGALRRAGARAAPPRRRRWPRPAVKLTPVTLEQDVKAALAKVKLGEVDAALVYRTDAKAAAADVDGIEFPESAGAINDYPIVALKDAPNPARRRGVRRLRADRARAQQVLTDAGFQKP